MKELENKSVSELEKIAEDPSSSDALRGSAALFLAIRYYFDKVDGHYKHNEKFQKWAQVAYKLDSGKFSSVQYNFLAVAFVPLFLNTPTIYCDLLVKSVMKEFKESAPHGKRFIYGESLKKLISLFLPGKTDYGFKEHSLEAVKSLNYIASQVGKIAPLLNYPNYKTNNAMNYLDQIYHGFELHISSIPKDKSHLSYVNQGFVFIECILQRMPRTYATEILNCCLEFGLIDAERLIRRSKFAEDKPLYATVLHGSDISCKTSLGRVYTYHVKPGDKVQILNATSTVETDEFFKVKILINNKEGLLNSSDCSLPMAPQEWMLNEMQESAERTERPELNTPPKPMLIAAPTAPKAEIKQASPPPPVIAADTTQNALVSSDLTEVVAVILKEDESNNYTDQQITEINAKIASALQIFNQSLRTAQEAERLALETIATMRQLKEQTSYQLAQIKEKMNTHEQYLFNVIKRLNELGPAFAALSAKVAKSTELATIREALGAQGHTSALTFLDSFVALMETEDVVNNLIKDGRLVYDYGRNGLVLDILVGIANLVPVPGVGCGLGIVKSIINLFQEAKIKAESKKYVQTSGKMIKTHKLPTAIAIAILKYNGDWIAKRSDTVAGELAIAAKNSAVKAIKALSQSDEKVYAEDIAIKILSGFGMDDPGENHSPIIKASLVAIANGRLLDSRYESETKECDWLAKVLLTHNGIPMSFEPLPQVGATQTSLATAEASPGRRLVVM